MFENIQNDGERGVSPVIGVILMVAITVILAAVIATFVIGLGDQTDDVAPSVSFSDSVENESQGVTSISIDTTDSDVDASNIEIVVGDNDPVSWQDATGNDQLAAGQQVTINASSDEIGSESASGSVDQGDSITIRFSTENTSDTLLESEVAEP